MSPHTRVHVSTLEQNPWLTGLNNAMRNSLMASITSKWSVPGQGTPIGHIDGAPRAWRRGALEYHNFVVLCSNSGVYDVVVYSVQLAPC